MYYAANAFGCSRKEMPDEVADKCWRWEDAVHIREHNNYSAMSIEGYEGAQDFVPELGGWMGHVWAPANSVCDYNEGVEEWLKSNMTRHEAHRNLIAYPPGSDLPVGLTATFLWTTLGRCLLSPGSPFMIP